MQLGAQDSALEIQFDDGNTDEGVGSDGEQGRRDQALKRSIHQIQLQLLLYEENRLTKMRHNYFTFDS